MDQDRPREERPDDAPVADPGPADDGAVVEQREHSQGPYLEPELHNMRSGGSCLAWLALLALLMLATATLVPNFMRARARGHLTACKSNLKNIGTALEMYATDYSGVYPSSLTALTPNYLKTIPECPSVAGDTYKVDFGPRAPMNSDRQEEYYYIECHGGNHKPVSITGNYPAYNSVQGLIERAP